MITNGTSAISHRERWTGWFRQSILVRHGVLLGGWLALWAAGWLAAYIDHTSLWFPVAGLTVAALMVMGLEALPTLVVGCVIITFADAYLYQLALPASHVLGAGLLFAAAHLTPYGAMALFLRRRVRRGAWHLTPLIVAFLVLAAVATFAAMALALNSLVYAGIMAPSEVPKAWLPFWVGDLAGVLAVAPLCIGLLVLLLPGALFATPDVPGFPFRRPTREYPAKLGLTVGMLVAAIMLGVLTRSPTSAFAIFFLVIPHMWIASSESPLVNALSVAISSFLIASLPHLLNLTDFALVYQFAICVIAANTLFALAVPALLAHNLELQTVAFTDAVTQVASRERLEQRAALEIVRAGLERRPLSLMVLDLDHFKGINDTHGHLVGDRALQRLCEVVQQSLRPTDMLGRIGGDEFAVLLPATALGAAELVATRVIEQLRDVRVAEGQDLTASFGLAEWRPGERYENLFVRADTALYQAKVDGRNRAVAGREGG